MTIAEIEDAIIDRLKDKGLQVKDIDIQKGGEGIPSPAVYIATEEGRFEKITQSVFKQAMTISLYIIFKHLKSEKDRRRGIYPILEGIVGILMLQDMGLSIQPLKPKAFKNITDIDIQNAGMMAFQIDFETSYDIKKMEEEAAVDLLTIGLNYYLKERDDDILDASDQVTL